MKTFTTLAALCLATACHGAERPADHAALAPLTAPSSDGLQRLHLPLAVLQQSRTAGLADLRVFNAAGESLPRLAIFFPNPRDRCRLTITDTGFPSVPSASFFFA